MENQKSRSLVVKRSVSLGGHKTSISLEEVFWDALKIIAIRRGLRLSQLADEIDKHRENTNLSSAIRVYVLNHCKEVAA